MVFIIFFSLPPACKMACIQKRPFTAKENLRFPSQPIRPTGSTNKKTTAKHAVVELRRLHIIVQLFFDIAHSLFSNVTNKRLRRGRLFYIHRKYVSLKRSQTPLISSTEALTANLFLIVKNFHFGTLFVSFRRKH